MRQIKIQANQTIFDIAVQEHGNVEGTFEILKDNEMSDIELTNPLQVGRLLDIREDSLYRKSKVLEELEGKIIYNE